jgi:hypothetical protein
VGRKLMEALLERSRGSRGVRVQHILAGALCVSGLRGQGAAHAHARPTKQQDPARCRGSSNA